MMLIKAARANHEQRFGRISCIKMTAAFAEKALQIADEVGRRLAENRDGVVSTQRYGAHVGRRNAGLVVEQRHVGHGRCPGPHREKAHCGRFDGHEVEDHG